MATTTTHYSLKKYEGADLFNPLTYENLNADTIDQAMFDNKQQAIGPATELVAGTVHALTRGNADSPIFAFTATGAFREGDTFTVDGTPVTALTTSGETLPDGAYVIGSEVICYLRSTQMTVFIYKKTDLSTIEGQITALESDVQDLEQEVLGSITTDGVEDYETAFNRLYDLISGRITGDNFYRVTIIQTSSNGVTIYTPARFRSDALTFNYVTGTTTRADVNILTLKTSGSTIVATSMDASGNTVNNNSSVVASAGVVFKAVLN